MGEFGSMGNLLDLPYPPDSISNPYGRLMLEDQPLSCVILSVLQFVELRLKAALEESSNRTSNTSSSR